MTDDKITLTCPQKWQEDVAINVAVKEVKEAYEGSQRFECNIHIIIDEVELKGDTYLIQQNSCKDQHQIVLQGGHELGISYGLFHVAKMIRMETLFKDENKELNRVPHMDLRLDFIHDNPGEDPFNSQFKNMETLLKYGYNSVVIKSFASLILYDFYKVKLYEEGSFERDWVCKKREEFRQFLEEAKRYHFKVFVWGDVLTLPYTIKNLGIDVFHDQEQAIDQIEEKLSGALEKQVVKAPEVGDKQLLCVGKPEVWELYQNGLKEFFESFPEVDGIIVRTGENYVQSDPTIMGNNPQDGVCNHCASLDAHARHRLIIEKTREITEKYGKMYFHRTWDFRGFHQDKDYYLKVVNEVEPSSGLFFSIKHTETDFWRYNSFNPCIGAGKHPQLIEFQCQREYEGKCAYPNFMGQLFSEGTQEVAVPGGMSQAYKKGVRAVWSWSRGGGWNGPYLNHEIWVNANVYAFVNLGWDTNKTPEKLAREWASLEFGVAYDSQVTKALFEILMDSEETVKKMLYIEEFCKDNKRPWGPNLLWVRDDDLTDRGIYKMAKYLVDQGKVEEAIKEKMDASQLCKKMLDTFQSIKGLIPDKKKAVQVENSLKYMLALSNVIYKYFEGTLLYHQWMEGFEYNTKLGLKALGAIEEWKEYWTFYRDEIPKLKDVPSLYEDVGMCGLMDSMYAHLTHHTRLDLKGSHWGDESKNQEKIISKYKS